LFVMRRPPFCECGYIKLFHPAANVPGDSQHLFDPYSVLHFLHGVIFFAILQLIAKRLPIRIRFLIALLSEVLWELFENSTIIVNRYRTATVSLGYNGDSIINSIGDVITMAIGFMVAKRLKLRHIAGVIIAIELFMLIWIRDNLTLNFIMLVNPIDAIKQWQLGAI